MARLFRKYDLVWVGGVAHTVVGRPEENVYVVRNGLFGGSSRECYRKDISLRVPRERRALWPLISLLCQTRFFPNREEVFNEYAPERSI